MQYIYKHTGNDKPTFVLLHGTGGDEYSLQPLIGHIKDDVNILSVRGNINENGMLRFFKRKAEGVYDLESLDEEMLNLRNLIIYSSEKYGFDINKVVLFGFSNGANIGLHLLLNDPNEFNYGIFMSPLYPLEIDTDIKNSNKKVFVSMGKNDPICSMNENNRLLGLFENLQIDTQVEWCNSHEVTYPIIESFTKWFVDEFETQ